MIHSRDSLKLELQSLAGRGKTPRPARSLTAHPLGLSSARWVTGSSTPLACGCSQMVPLAHPFSATSILYMMNFPDDQQDTEGEEELYCRGYKYPCGNKAKRDGFCGTCNRRRAGQLKRKAKEIVDKELELLSSKLYEEDIKAYISAGKAKAQRLINRSANRRRRVRPPTHQDPIPTSSPPPAAPMIIDTQPPAPWTAAHVQGVRTNFPDGATLAQIRAVPGCPVITDAQIRDSRFMCMSLCIKRCYSSHS